MTSKPAAFAIGAVLFTVINLLVLAVNLSIIAHAKIAGMDYYHLAIDTDFRRAVRDVVAEMDLAYLRRNSVFRSAVTEVVEGCHLDNTRGGRIHCWTNR